MNIKIGTGERVELTAPGASYTSCAIAVTTEGDRNILEVVVEDGRVVKIFLRAHGAWEQVFASEKDRCRDLALSE